MQTSVPLQAAEHWELALAVNPLHSEGWFSLGYCCLKRQNWTRALQAFTRCAQQQPDNGDAWNNLAAIHLQVCACCCSQGKGLQNTSVSKAGCNFLDSSGTIMWLIRGSVTVVLSSSGSHPT